MIEISGGMRIYIRWHEDGGDDDGDGSDENGEGGDEGGGGREGGGYEGGGWDSLDGLTQKLIR